MSTRGDILRRAAQVEPGAVPEPWRPSDDEDALATVSDREHYRKNLVTLPDGAGEVPAYVWDFPRTPTIPDEVREEWTRSSAGRVLNAQGQFVSRGSDVPRLSFDGDEAGLLVEAAGGTNQIRYSSDPTQWNANGGTGTVSLSPATSVVKNQPARECTGESGTFTQLRQTSAGGFSGSDETISFIMEKGTADNTRIDFNNNTSGKRLGLIGYDWIGGSVSVIDGSFASLNVRTLTSSGPNGARVVEVRGRVAGGNSENVSGESRRVDFRPDPNKNGDSTIFHHAQIEEAPNASSPIVTQGSPVTRSGDDYAIFEGGQPDWWNPNEGTFYAKVRPKFYYFPSSVMGLISDTPFQSSWIEVLNGSQPFSIRYQDGTNSDALINTLSAYEPNKVAVSVAQNKVRLSSGGNSITGNHNGDLLSVDRIRLGSANNLLSNVEKLVYYPRALPESRLNQITS